MRQSRRVGCSVLEIPSTQVQTNDNVVEIGEEITDTMETMMIIKK